MASSINASTSGGGGIITTADATGNLNIQSGGSTVVAVTSAGVAVTGTLSATGAVTLTTALPVLSGGTGVTTKTGTGAVVLGTSPTLATPTFDSAQLPTISGTAPLYMCRAWVNFNGTGTVAINASGNVSSITDSGTGSYQANFTTAMPDANYALAASGNDNVALITTFSGTYSTTTARVDARNSTTGGATDWSRIGVIIIR